MKFTQAFTFGAVVVSSLLFTSVASAPVADSGAGLVERGDYKPHPECHKTKDCHGWVPPYAHAFCDRSAKNGGTCTYNCDTGLVKDKHGKCVKPYVEHKPVCTKTADCHGWVPPFAHAFCDRSVKGGKCTYNCDTGLEKNKEGKCVKKYVEHHPEPHHPEPHHPEPHKPEPSYPEPHKPEPHHPYPHKPECSQTSECHGWVPDYAHAFCDRSVKGGTCTYNCDTGLTKNKEGKCVKPYVEHKPVCTQTSDCHGWVPPFAHAFCDRSVKGGKCTYNCDTGLEKNKEGKCVKPKDEHHDGPHEHEHEPKPYA